MRQLTLLILFVSLVSAPLSMIGTQDETTVTSVETSTVVYTTTSSGLLTIATEYSTSTVQAVLYSGPIYLDPIGQYCGIYENLPFTVKKGQRITGKLTSNSSIDFSIMREDDFKTWTNQRRCRFSTVGTLVLELGIISYDIDFSAPEDGQFEFLFMNEADSWARVEFDVSAGGLSTTVVAQTRYTYVGQTLLVTSLASKTILQTQQWGLPFSFGQNNFLLFAVVVSVGIAATVAFLLYRRKGEPEEAPKTRPKAKTGEMFCRKCGAKISRDSSFCLECGAATQS